MCLTVSKTPLFSHAQHLCAFLFCIAQLANVDGYYDWVKEHILEVELPKPAPCIRLILSFAAARKRAPPGPPARQ